tara:strand:+ start:133 stop:339 length:207 start_codon:yes stop_codon:yes gene_type:complete
MKNRNIPFVVFTCVILAMLIFPFFSIGNRVEPFIFGMPFSMIWVLFWIIIEFIGLVIFLRLDSSGKAD